jgi:hypothetical protein
MDANSTIKAIKDRLDRMFISITKNFLYLREGERASLIDENNELKRKVD